MRRRARFEQPVELELADGSTIAVDPGTCWVDNEGPALALVWERADREQSVSVDPEVMSRHLARRHLVFTSW